MVPTEDKIHQSCLRWFGVTVWHDLHDSKELH